MTKIYSYRMLLAKYSILNEHYESTQVEECMNDNYCEPTLLCTYSNSFYDNIHCRDFLTVLMCVG